MLMNSIKSNYLFKGIALLILDIITFVLVFSVWALINIRVFPWAFLAILITLIVVHVVTLASDFCEEQFGVGAYASLVTSTFLYYMFVMIFTGVTYIAISPKWYIVSFLISTLLYIAVVSGLYTSGLSKNKDRNKQKMEQVKVLDLTMQLMGINESIKKSSEFVEKSIYNEMIMSFNDMEERLKASTPFGRTIKPIIENIENRISSGLSEINEEIILLKTNEDNQEKCISIIKALNDVKSLIINREKLIIQ